MSSDNFQTNQKIIQEKYPNYAFIDGQNIETGLRLQGFEIDFELLFDYLVSEYKVKKVYYCVKFSNNGFRIKFFENLRIIGYDLVFSSGTGNGKVNVDADLIVMAMKNYFMVEKFGLILLSGDGDFVPLVRFFESEKKFVKIIAASKISTSSMLISDKHTKKRRYLTYLYEELGKLGQIISPRRRVEGLNKRVKLCLFRLIVILNQNQIYVK